MILGTLIGGLILVYPLWRIFGRVGLSPYFSLLIFVPLIGGLAVLAVLAFADWPAAPREIAPGSSA